MMFAAMAAPPKLCRFFLVLGSWIVCSSIWSYRSSVIAIASSNNNLTAATSDALILLKFKASLPEDSQAVLSSWTSSDISSVCSSSWTGVICSSESDGNYTSVTGLNFTEFNLNGTLSPVLCLLPNLARLSLRLNFFNQTFPSFLLQGCPRLTLLDLSQNLFYGPLPSNMSLLAGLQYLSLESNNFVGRIPPDFGAMPQLRHLSIRQNRLQGPIPPELGNLSALTYLDLSYSFSPQSSAGSIPPEIGSLSRLEILELEGCNLVGSVPASFSKLVSLSLLDISDNSFAGHLPYSLADNLTLLTFFFVYDTTLSGPLPSFPNQPFLTDLQICNNSFSGSIPHSYGNLSSLSYLFLFQNLLNGTLPPRLPFLSNLSTVNLFDNFLSGTLSGDWGLHSPLLLQFDVTNNSFTGSLPPNLCTSNAVENVSFANNQMSGAIPPSYGSCHSLIRVVLNDNQFDGAVPASVWVLPQLQALMLQNNYLSGEIDLSQLSPPVDGSQLPLQSLFLDSNSFRGGIPAEIGLFSNLIKLTASRNNLSGLLPSQIGSLTNLETLTLSFNAIQGDIPTSLGSCKALTSLSLAHNNLSGPIPPQLGSIDRLAYLDLSFNRFNGAIPDSMANKPSFVEFDVSNNNLSGTVPETLAVEFNASSFAGNPLLCYEPPCNATSTSTDTSKEEDRWRSKKKAIITAVVVTASILAIALVAAAKLIARAVDRKESMVRRKMRNEWKVTKFENVEFSGEDVARRLEERNLIGYGGSGRVYKVSFSNNNIGSRAPAVAVKKIDCVPGRNFGMNYGRSRDRRVDSFQSEMQILGNVRHRNIIRLLCTCERPDTKLLVYEYMPYGSLGDVLHVAYHERLHDWTVRFNIAMGVAEAIDYLHNDCIPPIIHRDIKSNNILLDSNMEPKLGDFGVAKESMLNGRFGQMTAVVGSVGYIAPEYSYTLKVNEKSDVYSMGVVLLELVTGRRPTGGGGDVVGEGEEMDMVRWAARKWKEESEEEQVVVVLDKRVVEAAAEEGSVKESMRAVLKIALLCTAPLPEWRPSSRHLLHLLRRAAPPPPPPLPPSAPLIIIT